jgi:23S rRNA (cytosine1962-C5)-methyltransferase
LRRKSTAELAPTAPLLGQAAPDEFVVREGPLRFWVRLADGLSTGLFLDQRDNRRRLFADCRGQQVLNLFAYNCSFSVAAGAGGAERVTSVDLSGAALARGDKNLVLNGLEPSQHRLLKADARKWLERAVRRQEPYDWIVLDPPVFASVGSDTFSVERDYQALATSALQLLRTGGRLLAVLNHRGTSARDHSAWVRAAAVSAGKSISKLEALVPPSDCAAEGVSVTKNLLLQVS